MADAGVIDPNELLKQQQKAATAAVTAPITTPTLPGGEKGWLGSQPTVDDSMAGQVAKLASQDSQLNRMAATEGLKAANRRGLLNSSMAVGAAQEAVLKNVIPIAAQESAQNFAKNQAAKAFEYGMTSQVQQQGWQTGENIAERGWQTAENIAQRGFLGTQADLDRDLQQTLQRNQIDAQQQMQIRQIASTEGIEAANRALQKTLQQNDIAFRMSEGKLDRASAEKMQAQDIAFRKSEGALDRSLQQKIASWNLSAAAKNSAAQFLTNMETMYQNSYSSIMGNTALDAATRTQLLTAAKNLRNNQINFVEQLFNVDLKW